jgi:acetyltransferase-like isoleucine patch superfamily enzyme
MIYTARGVAGMSAAAGASGAGTREVAHGSEAYETGGSLPLAMAGSFTDLTGGAGIPGGPATVQTRQSIEPGDERVPDGTPASNKLSVIDMIRRRGLKWLFSTGRELLLAAIQLRKCTFRGKWVRVRGRVLVENRGTIIIGDRVRFMGRAATSELVAWPGGRLEIGEGTAINYGTSISAASTVKIGSNCLIGTYVNIMDCAFHSMEDHSWNMDAQPIIIEDDVWLANRCVIMKGVRIGRGAVVGAGSIVTRDVPPHTLVLGVPARVIRHIKAQQ